MLIYKKMDITNVEKGMVAHGCNCVFVMGAGVALAIRKKWPIVYEKYMSLRHLGERMFKVVHFVDINKDLTIANCFTQLTTAKTAGERCADADAIRQTLEHCAMVCNVEGKDLYIPRIGSALGGLDWATEVLPIVEDVANQLGNLNLYVCDL